LRFNGRRCLATSETDCPRINFNSTDNRTTGEFKSKAESTRPRERVQNIQRFSIIHTVAVDAIGWRVFMQCGNAVPLAFDLR
jgi:hypothetical protein